jgi:hypothetical protein
LTNLKCDLRISKPRKTKFGDFKVANGAYSISVNSDLNPYRFAFTLIHELAHLVTHRTQKRSVQPHGKEWQNNYRKLLYSFQMDVFFSKTEQLKAAFEEEIRNPKAQAGLYGVKESVMSSFDGIKPGGTLAKLADGQRFTFKGVQYVKLVNRRTRALCKRLDNGKSYTISLAAIVGVAD